MNADVAKALRDVEEHVGCGDSSCRFVKPTGQSTNARCMCFEHPGIKVALARLFRAVKAEQGQKGSVYE